MFFFFLKRSLLTAELLILLPILLTIISFFLKSFHSRNFYVSMYDMYEFSVTGQFHILVEGVKTVS